MILKNKVVIVTGIGPGLGIKLALCAALEGAAGVVLASRSTEKLERAVSQIAELSPTTEVLAIPTDICDEAQCQSLVTATLDRFGRIDALVNSAYEHGKFESIEHADLAVWRSVMETNLIGTMQLTKAVVPAMKTQGGGAIVMINTQATRKPVVLEMGGESGYAASKAALANTVKYLALELGKYGIRVNSAFMGWMWGEPVQNYVRYQAHKSGISEQEVIAGVARHIPLGKISTDEDCAKAAMFLVSDYANAVTGAGLDINGGEYMP